MPSATTTPAPPVWHFKPLHEMTAEERLAALREWAEEKKYCYPGEGGLLGGQASVRGIAVSPRRPEMQTQQRSATRQRQASSASMPLPSSSSHAYHDRYAAQYDAPVGPPSYHVATRTRSVGNGDGVATVGPSGGDAGLSEKPGKFRRWLERRREKREERERRDSGLPDYEP